MIVIGQNHPGIQRNAIFLDSFLQDISNQRKLGSTVQKALAVHDAGGDEITGVVSVVSTLPEQDLTMISTAYINTTHIDVNMTIDNNLSITRPGIYEITYSGFAESSGINYTRTLDFDLNYTCLPTTNITLIVNNISNTTYSK